MGIYGLQSPRIPREHQLNTMGTLLGVHPIVPWKNCILFHKLLDCIPFGSKLSESKTTDFGAWNLGEIVTVGRNLAGPVVPFAKLNPSGRAGGRGGNLQAVFCTQQAIQTGFLHPRCLAGFLPSTVALESSLSSLFTSSAILFYTHSKKNLTEKY